MHQIARTIFKNFGGYNLDPPQISLLTKPQIPKSMGARLTMLSDDYHAAVYRTPVQTSYVRQIRRRACTLHALSLPINTMNFIFIFFNIIFSNWLYLYARCWKKSKNSMVGL